MKEIFSKKEKYILLTLGFFAVLVCSLAFVSAPSGALEIHFLNIGQGDAIFINTPSKRQVLIDGGRPDSPILEKISQNMPFYDRDIDLVVATHMDADHMGGLISVLENFKIGGILVSTTKSNTDLSARFWELIEEKDVPIYVVRAGDIFVLDKDVEMLIVSPTEQFIDTSGDNDLSVVVKLTYKDDSFLLTGDIEKHAEYALATGNVNLKSDVLKVAHHGSNTSTVQYFLNKVDPDLAVIQVGENRYGHPHPAVLERISAAGAKILRNDLNGDISLYSYGDSF
ncbi:MAG: ComEC/Rec2 family competence protein [Candidatus Spechtbacterales bacterium]